MIPSYRQDTIAAIATPNGTGALGIIRISGEDAIEKVNSVFRGKDLIKANSHTLHFGSMIFEDKLVDEVLVSVFRAPHSFTGENSIEISCHGSSYILQKLMELMVFIGIRPAEPGEFTLRAFMRGRMDLSQAEAVADLIAAESEAAHRTALQQMRGGFSQKIKELRQQLLHFASLVELELDFSEEDVEFADKSQLTHLLEKIYSEVEKLAESFKLGNAIKSGVKVVIAGKPNAGKSTLLNTLLQEERAIVSDIPGTTRDAIEDVIVIDGIKFRFIDTAGIRESEETIEKIGIARTLDRMKEADIIIYLYDIRTPEEAVQQELAYLKNLQSDARVIYVGNKSDLVSGKAVTPSDTILISARDEVNIQLLKKRLVDILQLPQTTIGDETVITNIRHYNSMIKILKSVNEIISGINLGITGDLLAADIRQALNAMGEITGEITNDEILGNIFSKFCIGK